jgi:2-haloacid dehalogenase
MTERITHLTFDCYGTLIDWEKGILAAVEPMVKRSGVEVASEAILRSFVKHEALLESQSWRPYRSVLCAVTAAMASDLGIPLPEGDRELLARSLPDWPPFPDTVDSLLRLGRRYRLVILSNTDDALFAQTQQRLGVHFDEIITAELVRSYKPGKAHFQEALKRLGVPVSQILHVAQSLYHDHAPAQQLGFRTAWVRRPSRLAGTGLAPAAQVKPDLVVPNLAALATMDGELERHWPSS